MRIYHKPIRRILDLIDLVDADSPFMNPWDGFRSLGTRFGDRLQSKFIENLATGDNVVFSAPNNQYLTVHSGFCFFPSGTSRTVFLKHRDAALTLTRISMDRTVASNAVTTAHVIQGGSAVSIEITLAPSEALVLNLSDSTAISMRYHSEGVLWPIPPPALTKYSFSLGDGNNTLYTCPAGKRAYVLPISVANAQIVSISTVLGANTPMYFNTSGAGRTYTPHYKRTGDTVGAATQVGAALSVNNNAGLIGGMSLPVLEETDQFVVVASGAGPQIAMFDVVEF
jgi:hypothetical protein